MADHAARCHNDQTMQAHLEDYRWLISADAAPWLERCRESSAPTVALVRQLRRELTAARSHLVLEQQELRRRAAGKFEAADRLFFTRQGLEQSTDQWVAQYKALRFPAGEAVADLCCGIGGDLLALARQSSVTGVDLNPVHALLAEANARALELPACTVRTADAGLCPVQHLAAWHIDPDRRVQGRRTAQPCFSEPPVEALRRLLAACPHAALKLAPSADIPDDWTNRAERQWIGSGRECRQQVVWFASLAHHPRLRSALVVDRHGLTSPPLVGTGQESCPTATAIRRFLFEPHACVLAARLTAALGTQFNLEQLDPQVAYLTGDHLITDARLAAFEVLDVLPFDLRKLRAALNDRRIGDLEVKKRGVAVDPAAVRRQLQGRGDQQAVLIISPHAGAVRAILARRQVQEWTSGMGGIIQGSARTRDAT